MGDRDVTGRARVVRATTALLALGLAALGLREEGLVQGALFAGAIGLVACCFVRLDWNARALVLFASTALSLLAAELGLRLLLSPRYYPPFQLEARRHYALVPGAQREYRRTAINGGERILYRVNSAGFRGEELAVGHAVIRVVVYGDSFIQAEYSELPHTFAERLERRLAEASGRAVEVVNAGVAGYGPDQILRRMEAELSSLRPDLVLVALFAGNDFGDLVRNKLYRLDAEGGLRENSFTLEPSLRRKLETSRREPILRKLVRGAVRPLGEPWNPDEDPSARAERMESFLARSGAEYREYVIEGDDVVRELLSDPYNADVSLTPGSDSARYKIAMMDAVLAEMKRLTEHPRIPLGLILIPHPIDVDRHESAEVNRARHPTYEPSGLTDILERIAKRHAIPCVNLFAPFRERGGRALYFRGADDHWNDLGQDVAAALASEFVTSRRLLDGSHR